MFLGEELYLGLGPALTLLDAGSFGIGGLHLRSIRVPGAGVPAGVVLYLQALVADARAPNGFRASNGESTVLYNSARAMVEEFSDPVLQGYTGTFDKTRRHRLAGAAISRRVHTVRPRSGAKFGLGVYGPLNPDGARVQMVYRSTDIGATGVPEVLTALRWLPFGPVSATFFPRLVIDVGHTRVTPDYTIDSWSRLPRFPLSGLNTVFANNPKAGEKQLRIIDGGYAIQTKDVRADGYLSYPTPIKNFVYNGYDSLLLDFKMSAQAGARNPNGQQIQLMVLSSPRPNGRIHASGKPGAIVDPHKAVSGGGDNSMSYMQFEFTRVESVAVSPWRMAPVANPNYHPASKAKSVPPGASLRVEYRGADSATGTGSTPWSYDVNNANRKQYLQYRITMWANPTTGAVPSIEALVIPIN